MKVLNDFTCPEGHTNEYFADNETKHIQCQECNCLATKIIKPIRFHLEGVTGSFPGAAMKWQKRREAKLKEELHNANEHGD